MSISSPADLQKALGYSFKDTNLLEMALCHPSAYRPEQAHLRKNYERLEYLGDALIGMVIAEELYLRLPNAQEGQLTQLRSRVASRANLGQVGKGLQLGKYVKLGLGEERNNLRQNNTLLANCFESVIGAIYLDSDFHASRTILLGLLDSCISEVCSNPVEHNPKGQLQSILQAINKTPPSYSLLEQNEREFVSGVHWCGQELGRGSGSTKQKSEIAAAEQALQLKTWTKL